MSASLSPAIVAILSDAKCAVCLTGQTDAAAASVKVVVKACQGNEEHMLYFCVLYGRAATLVPCIAVYPESNVQQHACSSKSLLTECYTLYTLPGGSNWYTLATYSPTLPCASHKPRQCCGRGHGHATPCGTRPLLLCMQRLLSAWLSVMQ